MVKKILPLIDKDRLNQKLTNKTSENTERFDQYLTRTFSILDFFPYHSKKFSEKYKALAQKDYLSSQKFIFEIIKDRINNPNNEVTIIICRSFRKWYEVIPILVTYEKCYKISNPHPSFKLDNISRVTRVSGEKQISVAISEDFSLKEK